jgi:hypothetical protein
MIRRPLVLLLVAGSVGVAAAGCGSSSTTTTTTTSSAPASAPTTTAAPATTTTSGSTGAAAAVNPAVAQIVGACKSRIDSAGNLSASVKSKLTTLCDKAASGDEGGARKAASQVCQEIIKATVPQSVQNQALAGCPKA